MFEFSKTVYGKVNLDNLWNLYADVSKWKLWDSSVDEVKLNGTFSEGSHGIMEMKNGQALPFVIQSVSVNKEFTTVSELDVIKVTFIHWMEAGSITHKVIVESAVMNDEQLAGIGHGITADLPQTMENLLDKVSI